MCKMKVEKFTKLAKLIEAQRKAQAYQDLYRALRVLSYRDIPSEELQAIGIKRGRKGMHIDDLRKAADMCSQRSKECYEESDNLKDEVRKYL